MFTRCHRMASFLILPFTFFSLPPYIYKAKQHALKYHLREREEKRRDRTLAMASLQRSSKSFRRQGSSGSVWDDKVLSEEGKVDHRELRPCHSIGGIGMMELAGGSNAAPSVYTRSLSAPAKNPPSPKSVKQGFVGVFEKPPTPLKSNSGKHA